MRPEEFVEAGDVKRLSGAAANLYLRIRQRAEVSSLLSRGRCYYELPFSWAAPDRPGAIVRGRIDCVVESPDGSLTILEIKTGRPRPEHDAQVDVYKQALESMLPDRVVLTRLVYP